MAEKLRELSFSCLVMLGQIPGNGDWVIISVILTMIILRTPPYNLMREIIKLCFWLW